MTYMQLGPGSATGWGHRVTPTGHLLKSIVVE